VSASAIKEVSDWLEKLGMSEYVQRFAENGITAEALRHLTDQYQLSGSLRNEITPSILPDLTDADLRPAS
jgi:hypothetical protein